MIQLRSKTGLSQYGFADLIGFSRGYLAAMEQGRKWPSRSVVMALMEHVGADPEWLLFGRSGAEKAQGASMGYGARHFDADRRLGKLIRTLPNSPPNTDAGEIQSSARFRLSASVKKLVNEALGAMVDDWATHGPYVDLVALPFAQEVRAAAGSGEPVFDESTDFRILIAGSALDEWADRDSTVVVRVVGDSMEPGLRDGDFVAADCSRIDPVDGKRFVVRTEGGLVVKRMRLKGNRWWLMSDNKERGSRGVVESDRIVGRVAWTGPPRTDY